MIDFKFYQKGRKNTITKLSAVSRDISRPRSLFARWGVQALRWIDQNFKEEGGLIKEGSWKRLRLSTIRARRKGRKGSKRIPKILQDTGKMKASFVYRMLSDGRGIAVGTNVKYAKNHEHGTKAIPQRRMLPTEKDASFTRRLRKTTDNYMKKLIRRRGGGR